MIKVQSVSMEITNVCNLKCSFCPLEVMQRPKGFMELSLAKEIVDQVADNHIAERFGFTLMGEPTLHPDFIEICRYVKSRRLKASLCTNGSTLTNKIIDSMLSVPFDSIHISCRAVDEETLRMYGAKLTLNEYLNGIIALINRKRELSAPTEIRLKLFKPTLMDFVTNRAKTIKNHIDNNIHRVFIDKIAAGLDSTFNRKLRTNFLTPQEELKIRDGVYLSHQAFTLWNEAEGETIYKAVIGACDGLKTHFAVLWNGELVTCCLDYDGKNCLGNLKEHSVMDILNSRQTLKVRNSLKRCILPTQYCKICRGGPTLLTSLFNQLGSILVYKVMHRVQLP
ncbi:MAG: radical SAM protein [Candidatus Omnitrophota bacterium]